VEQLLWTKVINDGGSHGGIPVIAWNFSTSFIGNNIVSTSYILVFRDAHIIEHKPISWDSSLFFKDKTSHFFHV